MDPAVADEEALAILDVVHLYRMLLWMVCTAQRQTQISMSLRRYAWEWDAASIESLRFAHSPVYSSPAGGLRIRP